MTAINFPANPSNGDTHQGFVYNSTLGVWQSAGTQTAVTSFTGLSDTPSTLGTAGQIAKVNSGATALEFADQSGVTVYATADLLPGTANAGDMAFVTATNRLYLWNGSGWYNIALINTTPSISGVNSSYDLASDGTATVITITAVDAEGLPITYSIASDTSGNIATVTQGTGASSNVFTITPSTDSANGGTFSLTFRASDGVNIASSIASFTLQFRVQNSNYTTALITSVGGNNAVNNDFVDSSTNSHTITAAGNATQTTFSPYRHGGYSTYFDGSGDYLTIADDASLDLGSSFTIEFWIYNIGTGASYLFTNYSGVSDGIGIQHQSSGSLTVNLTGDANDITSSNTVSRNEWHHIALVCGSGSATLYVDGVSEGTFTGTIAGDTTNQTQIGAFYWNNTLYSPTQGYISDFRIVKNSQVYTTAFTPPTERLTAITNTSLLTCHLPYIADGSTNGHAITVNGNTKTEPFAPYDYQEYSSSSHGGSMYFDGNGDYLKITNTTTSVSGDFTIECWVNFSSYASSGANSRVFSMKPGGNTADNLQLLVGLGDSGSTTGSVSIWTNAYTAHATTVVADGSWHHIAVTRESGTVKIYIDGVVEGSGSNSTTFDFSGHKIGTRDETADATSKFSGTIAEFRTVVGTAVYTSNFTPPTAPLTDVTNTLALVQGTNASIIDKSQSVKSITLNGDATSSTTQTKYLTSSMYFDGAGDYIVADGLALGSIDFTVEFWMRGSDVNPSSNFRIIEQTTGAFAVDIGSAGKIRAHRSGGNFKTAEGVLTQDTWHHVAVVREGTGTNEAKIYIDGTLEATGTLGDDYTDTVFEIGGNSTYYTGYLSDVRITKGLARYTANFTPPTAELKG